MFSCILDAISSQLSYPQYTSINHYNDVIMRAMASLITRLMIVYSTVYSRRRWNKTSKLRVTGLCAGNSPVTSEFSTQRASNAENVSIWWRHHARRRRQDYRRPFWGIWRVSCPRTISCTLPSSLLVTFILPSSKFSFTCHFYKKGKYLYSYGKAFISSAMNFIIMNTDCVLSTLRPRQNGGYFVDRNSFGFQYSGWYFT